MATVTQDAKEARVWFKDAAGARRSIRLGAVHNDYANRFALFVEDLNTAVKYNATLRPETAQWVAGLCDELQNRLAALGLIEIEQAGPDPRGQTLGAFIDAWVASRHDVKPATKQIYSRSRHFLVEYFGEERLLDSITAGDADEWALFLRSKLNENTSRKMAAVAKLFLKRAERKKLIEVNPFSDLRCNVTHDETGNSVLPDYSQGRFRAVAELVAQLQGDSPDGIGKLIPNPRSLRMAGKFTRRCQPQLSPRH